MIDRELHIPSPGPVTVPGAGRRDIPDEVEFATKPVLAQAMLERAIDASVPFSWVTADEAYGQVKYQRVWLETAYVSYVLATRCDDDVFATCARTGRGDELIAAVRPRRGGGLGRGRCARTA